MHILLINYEFPPLGGGAGNATQNLAREMATLGHEVMVLTARFRDLPHQEAVDGYTVYRIPTLRRAAHRSNSLEMLIFMVSAMWQVLRLAPVDYSIAFFGIPSAPAAWVLKFWHKTPYIVSLRGGDVPGFQPYDLKWFHLITRPFIWFLWVQAEHVVANSQGLATLAQLTTPNRPIQIIPNGVNTEKFTPAPQLPPAKILFVGRLQEQKGLYDLVEAVALLPAAERAQVQITLVGDGPLRETLFDQIAKGHLQQHFNWVGWVDRAQIPAYYQAHSLFVLPSLDEGMPNVILEAMACGLPIIATQIAGNEELVGENGWLVPPRTPLALSKAIQAALTDPARLAEMGKLSRQQAEGYSWRSVAEQYLALMGVG